MAELTKSRDAIFEGAINLLEQFLNELCISDDKDSLSRQFALTQTRWTSVEDLLKQSDRVRLHQIAFNSPEGGFSPGGLKAHYVLDEEFINGGSALIVFRLVGSDWTFVVQLNNQNRFTPPSLWCAGETQ